MYIQLFYKIQILRVMLSFMSCSFTGNMRSISCHVSIENIRYMRADTLRKANRRKRSLVVRSDGRLPRTSSQVRQKKYRCHLKKRYRQIFQDLHQIFAFSIHTFFCIISYMYLKYILGVGLDLTFAIREFLVSVELLVKCIPPLHLREPNPCLGIMQLKDLRRYLYKDFIT